MSDINILHEMIKDAAKVSFVDNYGKKQVKLEEPQHPEASVTIHGMPDNAIVIKADTFRSPDSVFKGTQGECKRADFVIIADGGINKKVIICIEIKAMRGKRMGTEKEVILQLKGAQCFVAYCREIGRLFWDKPDFLNGFVYRFVSIGNISISKKRSRIDLSKDIHDRPDKMMKISSPHRLEFKHLAGVNRS